MIDDDLEQEDVDNDIENQDDVEGAFNGPDSDEPEDVNEQDEPPVTNKKASKPSMDEEELPSVEAKQKDRDELERAMQEFLAKGGTIQTVGSDQES